MTRKITLCDTFVAAKEASMNIRRRLFPPSATLALLLTVFALGCASAPEIRHEVALAKGVEKQQNTSVPKSATDVFFTGDAQAVMWVRLSEVTGKHALKWEWYDTKGTLYQRTADYPVNSDGAYRYSITSWHSINIRNEKAASLPGRWIVKVYLDGNPIATREFEIAKISDLYDLMPGKQGKAAPDGHKWAVSA